MRKVNDSRAYILYCSLAGFIASWAISGMLVAIDFVSGTPIGSFFATIGFSLGYYDIATAQAIGFGLHLLTGLTAGNIFGQISMFWPKLAPFNPSHGVMTGVIVGLALWAVLFVPLATLGIQPRLDEFKSSSPNQSVNAIALRFEGLYYVIIGGAFVFHLAYGAFMGLIAGRMNELRSSHVQTLRKDS